MLHLAAREKARQQYEAAFHLLNVTFRSVNDPRLLIGVINNISQSLEYCMEAILAYERELKLVPKYLDNFQSKFNIFRYRCIRRNNISPEVANLMSELREIIELQKASPMEFQRGNKYVLATRDYKMKILSIKEIKGYIEQNKQFLECTDTILRIQKGK